MKSSAFIATSAIVMLLLGFLHLWITFSGPQLHPRDPDLTAKMMTISPIISGETTMWRLWIGFNVTHSLFLILFGAVYSLLAIHHSELLFRSWYLLALGFALLLGSAIVAKLCFFTSPFRWVLLAAVLYLLGIIFNKAWTA
jgi:hypothetical protein